MLAKDFMTKDVVTVEIPSSRDDVLRILKRTVISCVPVVKGEEKKLLGIVTIKDILRKPEETQIALLMTSDPLTIEPDTDIAEAARIMGESDTECFYVMTCFVDQIKFRALKEVEIVEE